MKKIGIIGGGQISKMMISEGKKLNIRFIILDPQADCPAHSMADRHIVAEWNDFDAVKHLASMVDVITYDPACISIKVLEEAKDLRCAVYPSLKTQQLLEKEQALLDEEQKKKTKAAEKEKWKYIMVSAGRSAFGKVQLYPIAEVTYADGIWDELTVPAKIEKSSEKEAVKQIKAYMEKLSVCGMFRALMAVSQDGQVSVRQLFAGPDTVLDFSLESCYSSQYENHIRAIIGYPLGSAVYAGSLMVKHIRHFRKEGDEIIGLKEIYSMKGVKCHLYGKRDGDISVEEGTLFSAARSAEEAFENLHKAYDILEGNKNN